MKSINPSTKEILGEVQESTQSEVTAAVTKARAAFKTWSEMPLNERVEKLRKVSEKFKEHREEFIELTAKEMGMPVSQAQHDIDGSLEYFEWYLDNAEKYLSPEVTYEDEEMKHTVYREAIGVIAIIIPWNFPLSNFIWKSGQALIAGNTIILKHSEETILSGQLIEKIFNETDLPEGVFNEVYGAGEVGEHLLHCEIDFVGFKGSTKTGKEIYKKAAEKFIPTAQELGGSAPGIVLEDANIPEVIETIYANRFDNCGQICDGLKRLIVHESKLDEVLEQLKNHFENITVGDASDKSTDIGPLVSEKQLNALTEQYNDAIENGAKIEIQIEVPNELDGFFFAPTVLTNINTEMKVWNEEVFGPILPIVTFKTIEEAIELANDTKYGLGGYVFTSDNEKFREIARKVKTGMIQQNNTSYVVPASPFGGCKISGIGRENGKYGFMEVTEIKLVSEEKK